MVIAAAALFAPDACRADRWSVDAGVASELTRTTNASLGLATSAPDTIIAVRPHIRLLGEGARLRVSGTAALNAIGYAENTQPKSLDPEIDLDASLQAIERFLFVDASLRAIQESANPFGARPEPGATTANSMTTAAFRVAPRIEGTGPGLIKYRLLSDNTWTNDFNAPATVVAPDAVGYFGQHTLSIGREPAPFGEPVPFGWQVEAQHSETRYRDSTLEPLKVDLARATLGYRVAPDLILGLRGGREHTNFTTTDGNNGGSIYGIDLRWQPSPRTQLLAWQEHRFFGSSWNLDLAYRTPKIALTLTSSRQLDTSPQSLLDLPATNNVAALLDAILTAQFPDPVQRSQIVNNLIAQRGLPSSTLQPITLQAQRLSVRQQTIASVAILGVRNSVTFSAYRSKTEDAVDSGPLAAATAPTNNLQYGASVTLAHRLTPVVDLIGSADWSRIEALETVGTELSTQHTLRLRVNRTLSLKTTVYAGARLSKFDSNTAVASDEKAAFVGIDHRF
jgi:uncharacterized protein (PEP-CTERM system associated)